MACLLLVPLYMFWTLCFLFFSLVISFSAPAPARPGTLRARRRRSVVCTSTRGGAWCGWAVDAPRVGARRSGRARAARACRSGRPNDGGARASCPRVRAGRADLLASERRGEERRRDGDGSWRGAHRDQDASGREEAALLGQTDEIMRARVPTISASGAPRCHRGRQAASRKAVVALSPATACGSRR